jgi:hypothetical protein
MCVLFLSTTFVPNIFRSDKHRRVTLEMCTEPHVSLHEKYPLFLSDFDQNCKVLTYSSITPKY